jgi:uncharacterized protein with NRDE domain
MCLVAVAIDQDRRFPLVIAANRDEYFERPAARLAWWASEPGAPEILGGRDLRDGGTWLGLTAAGRMALVTNIRRPGSVDPTAPSRGRIVPLWLRGDLSADRFWMQAALSGHNPFNLIAADFRRGECYWASSDVPSPRRLDRGLYGLSNAGLDTPWPKVERLKEQLTDALPHCTSAQALSARLFSALADRTQPDDDTLPHTGVALEWERLLAPAFIRTPDQRYGTRCSTLIITERINKRLVTHVFERTFPAGGGLALLRQSTLRDWPPKYGEDSTATAESAPVSESEVTASAEPIKRTRVRSLLKPEGKRRRATTTL